MVDNVQRKAESTVLLGSADKVTESVQKKRPKLWPDKWILHHDSAPAHDALRVCEFMAKKAITKMDHPLYSPDLAPYNFWLFP
jgi:hypothetical protein